MHEEKTATDKEIIYLDNSATSFPKPREVIDFMCAFYRRCGVNPGRSGYDLAIAAEEILTGTRKKLLKFFNGKGNFNRVVFAYNATEALNNILFGMVEEEDHVLTSTLEHNAVLRPLHYLKKEGGVMVEHVPFNEEGYLDPEEFPKRFRENTALVILNHGSNVIGTLQPIKEIGASCREAGIPFAVDASQTAGAVPINLEEMNIDVIAFTGHKSLMGPTGIGGLFVREGIDIRPTRFGGTGVNSAALDHPEEYPWRLECGTVNLLGVAGLHAGLEFIEKEGLDAIYRREMQLTRMLLEGFSNIKGVRVYGASDMERHLPVLSINIDGYLPQDAGTFLDVDFNIATRTGLHCAPLVHEQMGTAPDGTIRFSIGPFNTPGHIEHAIRAVRELAPK